MATGAPPRWRNRVAAILFGSLFQEAPGASWNRANGSREPVKARG
jgi:hypothetical protein